MRQDAHSDLDHKDNVSTPTDSDSLSVRLSPEQYHLNNSAYGPFGQGLPHPHSNHSTVGLNKYTSLKAVGKLVDKDTHKVMLTPTDTVTFKYSRMAVQELSGDEGIFASWQTGRWSYRGDHAVPVVEVTLSEIDVIWGFLLQFPMALRTIQSVTL